jgi:hypothetical protein
MASYQIENMSLGDLMSTWLGNLQEEQELPPSNDPDDLMDDAPKDTPSDQAIEEDVTTKELGFNSFRNFIFRSPAYEWLVTTLHQQFLITAATEDALENFATRILSSLAPIRELGGKSTRDPYSVVFCADWEPLAFVIEQEYSDEPGYAIEQAITITGSITDAQALTCKDYMGQLWPQTGEPFLDLVKKLITETYTLRNNNECSKGKASSTNSTRAYTALPDDTRIAMWIEASKTFLRVIGTADSIIEAAQQIAWLGAALRSSPIEHGIVSCMPFIKDISTESSISVPGNESTKNDAVYYIGYTKKTEKTTRGLNGQCWHDLFQNPVVVGGFPILSRPHAGIGLEISLEMMAGLIQAQKLTYFDKRPFIKSFSVILFPTRIIDGCMIWHMVVNDTDHISYADPRVRNILNQNQSDITALDLPVCRHFLGWCSKVRNYAGMGTHLLR